MKRIEGVDFHQVSSLFKVITITTAAKNFCSKKNSNILKIKDYQSSGY